MYIVRQASPKSKQLNVFDLIEEKYDPKDYEPISNYNTITHDALNIPDDLRYKYNISVIINQLKNFNNKYDKLFDIPRSELYDHFYIPKRSVDKNGKPKFREINSPKDQLSVALTELKGFFEFYDLDLYHTSAFAYVKRRAPADVTKKHQYNKSHWWLLTDFHDFFGSITEDFLFSQISNIFPFSIIIKCDNGALKKALSLCFLNGGLPQGTPISPMLTNIVMIPFDYQMSKILKGRYVYTRYADDIQISSRAEFNYKEILNQMNGVLIALKAPFELAKDKTKYRNGSVFVLGVMYNQNCQRTVGHKNKKVFRATLFNYLCDRLNGIRWDKEKIMEMQGKFSYYVSIEKKVFLDILDEYSKKFDINVMNAIKEDLRA